MSALCRLSSYISHLYGTGGKGFAHIYPRFPWAREHSIGLHNPLEFHHREDRPRPPSSPATVVITLGLWLDGSIIILAPRCHGFTWVCLSRYEPLPLKRLLAQLSSSFPIHHQKNGTRFCNRCCIFCFRAFSLTELRFQPLHYFIPHFFRIWVGLFHNFL